MPTYDYVCDACGQKHEVFQRISEDPLTICTNCNSPTLRRLISGGAAVIFKGDGFYCNESKKRDKPKKSGGAAEPAAKPSEHNPDTPYAKPPKQDSE